jgi:hypothetical protein
MQLHCAKPAAAAKRTPRLHTVVAVGYQALGGAITVTQTATADAFIRTHLQYAIYEAPICSPIRLRAHCAIEAAYNTNSQGVVRSSCSNVVRACSRDAPSPMPAAYKLKWRLRCENALAGAELCSIQAELTFDLAQRDHCYSHFVTACSTKPEIVSCDLL